MKFLNFLPKEEKFYLLLNTLTQQAKIASVALHKAIVESDDSSVWHHSHTVIHQARLEAKVALRSVVEEVCRTFITPFDREDLQELASALYSISSCLDGVKQRLHQHNLRPKNGDFNRFSQIVVHQSGLLEQLIHGLNHSEKPELLQEKVASLYELEDHADQALLELESALFRQDPIPDVRELILRKDIYGQLEDITDAYRDVAAIALRIILKHS
jgi:uncharacterized protein Yka (UPF0111/DUF47 family)